MKTRTVKRAMKNLDLAVGSRKLNYPIPFEKYLAELIEKPEMVLRNIFQVFYDMVKIYVGEGIREAQEEDSSFKFIFYDWSKLFVEGVDQPFFADRLFAHRLMSHVEALKSGAQQNKIYVFDGPPGCGKSTFLNNLLMKIEAYANTQEGMRYETVWRLDPEALGTAETDDALPMVEQFTHWLRREINKEKRQSENISGDPAEVQTPPYTGGRKSDCLEFPCPSHDNPILLIPKANRRSFLNDLLTDDIFKEKLFHEKVFEWVFEDTACTICTTLYDALIEKLGNAESVFKMVYARPYRFNRRLGEGISVYNPGDRPVRQNFWKNPGIEKRLNSILGRGELIQYLFSRFAKTNNGVYALMDIKLNNTDRMIELHNIISEGVHKVEDMEENVNSLFFAVMNPEDKSNVQNIRSFSDRIEYIHIPYVLDIKTEIEIYREIFGPHIEKYFLPRVLRNFARIIISSRLKMKSEILLEWISDPEKYAQYCDINLQLLKIEIYIGNVPPWLSEEDRKRLTKKRRRRILAEAETEGNQGFSGRDSIKIFSDFLSSYASEGELISILDIYQFFDRMKSDFRKKIPDGFLDALLRFYNFKILQEVKESLFNFNEDQIGREIQNYLFALNFDIGSTVICRYTGEKIDIDESFFEGIENRILGSLADKDQRLAFRKDTQKEYTSKSLTQEMMVEGKDVTSTLLFQELFERYVFHLKEKVLDPFWENENFRRAIRDYDEISFKSYDKRIQRDVHFLIQNLCEKFHYTPQGAREICIYVIDSDLTKEFMSASADG